MLLQDFGNTRIRRRYVRKKKDFPQRKVFFMLKAKSAYFAPKMSKYPATNTTRMIIGAIHLR